MRFLSTGDFNFPFDLTTYWIKHAFMWSFQSGTPNPDGLIRLPGRIFNFIMFALFGNVGASYFYIFAPLIIAFLSFYFFAKHFLQIKSKSVQIIGALFFACNPIFLGNIAKIGLVLAAAMLPFCLLAIQTAFHKRQLRYLLLLVLCINISFLHPYTFTVNLVVSGAYFLYMAWNHKAFIIDNVFKLILVGMAAIGLNLYFALPMLSMGSVSKDMISTNITPTPIDYTALVGISNTGNFFTGFSLSKNVFVDFAFYDSTYQNIYFFGVFLFYVLLLWLILRAEPHLQPHRKRQMAVLLGAFLGLIALAATTVLHVDDFIRFLISMPGGWAFRSPLKWQLYIPMTLFGVMVIALAQIKSRRILRVAQSLLLITFVIMNGYLFLDVYRKILVPRSLTNFASLYDTNMDYKTVLFVNNGPCMDYMREHPRVVTEFNQVFTSKNTQLKNVLVDNTTAVNLGSYDYLITCKPETTAYLKPYSFTKQGSFVQNTFQLYKNKKPVDRIFSPEHIYGIQKPQDMGKKYSFVNNDLDKSFSFSQTDTKVTYPTTKLADVFEDLSPTNISQGTVGTDMSSKQDSELYVKPSNSQPLYFGVSGGAINFTTENKPGLTQVSSDRLESIPLKAGNQVITYTDKSFDYKNLIKNPSFESDLWQPKVDDCYNYDNNPDIGMKQDQKNASEGSKSLQLRARQHIACTGPGEIEVKGGEHVLLSFDYQSDDGKYAGYYVSYDDPARTSDIVRMQEEGKGWHSFSQELAVPEGASHINIKLYAYPHTYGEVNSIVHYDNVSLMKTPAMQDRFYAVSNPKEEITPPKSLTYEIASPTKKVVHIKGANGPFYVADIDSYNALWHAEIAGKRSLSPFANRPTIASADHIRLNNTMNAWYVNPASACGMIGANCQKQSDGSYDMDIVIEFMPQRWFYLGAIVSGITFVACVIYFVRSGNREKEERR